MEVAATERGLAGFVGMPDPWGITDAGDEDHSPRARELDEISRPWGSPRPEGVHRSAGSTRSFAGPGLLLRQAVERPEAEDQVDAVDADDLAIGEELRQGVQRDAIGRVIEGGNQDQAVCDVEVGIAR